VEPFAHLVRGTLARILPLLIASGAALACSSAGTGTCDLPNVSHDDCSDAHEMQMADALPPARGDMYADNEDAANLGFKLFFDANLGSGVSCAVCHAPESAFTDRLPVSTGKTIGTRNTPTVFNAARLSVFFWDGRADSLWSQPLFPLENPAEMATDRLTVAQFISTTYDAEYESAFGPLPDMSSWPAAGKPGDAAFDNLSPDTQTDVNRFFSNIGKAFEAYMRKNCAGSAPLDAFLKGDSTQIISAAQRGLQVFLSNKCQSCHSGPMLTDEQFHDVGFPSLPDAAPDLGRAAGLPELQADIFNLSGPFADPGPGVPGTIPSGPAVRGAFRTPSLRNVTQTFPYGHDGALTSLSDVLAVHAPGIGVDDQGDLQAFFGTLTGEYPPLPWSNWPTPQ
jgi:cytochrome c peroxidase